MSKKHRSNFSSRIVYGLILLSGSFAPHLISAHTFCVNSVADLRNALSLTSTNGMYNAEDNVIQIARGTYDANGAAFAYESADSHELRISGGYNYGVGTCPTQIQNPELTILDGNAMSQVWSSNNSAGALQIRWLTFQNGFSLQNVGGAIQLNSFKDSTGDVVFNDNIIRNSHAKDTGGIAIQTGGTGSLQLRNNLLVDNLSDISIGACQVYMAGAGGSFVNNTVANNIVTASALTGGCYFSGPQMPQFTLSNNIFWGNTRFDIINFGNLGVLVKNDLGNISGTGGTGSAGNVNVDPKFVSTTNFRLLANSPVLGQGTITPAGGISAIDITGNPRQFSSTVHTVDMGAYERGDELFTDGFDD
jgi:hypothetical protein